MSRVTLPFPNFQPGTKILSAQANANNSALTAIINGGLDNTNVGTAGFFASQIKPTDGTEATFGGGIAYTFPSGLTLGGGLTIAGTLHGVTSMSITDEIDFNNGNGGVLLDWNDRNGDNVQMLGADTVGSCFSIVDNAETIFTLSLGGDVEIAGQMTADGGFIVNGLSITADNGAPSGGAPSGSMYLRKDGSAGARLYINQNGSTSWAAVAGV